jgi:hypothetical protein
LGRHAEADFAYQAATRLDPSLTRVNDIPPTDQKPGDITRTAVISIRRRSEVNSAALAWIVLIDGNNVGQIRASQPQEYPVAPGTHRIQVKMNPRWGQASSPVEVVTLNAGERASFVCHTTHPFSMKESVASSFSPSKWKEKYAAPKDSYITLDRE